MRILSNVEVPLTRDSVARSRMKGNFHVRFWRRVRGVTQWLSLIAEQPKEYLVLARSPRCPVRATSGVCHSGGRMASKKAVTRLKRQR